MSAPMTAPVTVDVCVCTFRRATLEATLESLARQNVEGMRVIVADNDEAPTARAIVERLAPRLPYPVLYVHAPARNISIARNAALDAATATWVAVIDDDETAGLGWLAAFLAAAGRTGADVLLGPVRALYGADQPRWMVRGDFHSATPPMTSGEIRTGYTSNVMFRRESDALAGLRFRLDLGRSGGEDTEFFHRAYRRGAKIVFVPEAVVSERVEPQRASLAWLMRRRYRSGQSHGRLVAADVNGAVSAGRALALAGGKFLVSAAGAGAFAFSAQRRAFWLLRASLHAGVVAHLLGARDGMHYGTDASETP